jgi:peptidyl-prolyl cis-trans isomerase D
MFDFIRNHNKAIQIGMMIFVLPGFFLFGIDGFNKMGEKSETVAVVAGQNIGQIEWDAAIKTDAERISQSSPTIDPKLFDSAEFRYAALERLVRQRVLATAATKLYLNVSDQRLAAELVQNPLLAALRKPDGSVDDVRYKEILAPQGLTPQSFEARVRSDLSAQQVVSSLAKSGMVPASLADVALNAYFERREIQILNYSPAEFAKQIKPTDAEVEAFYKSNTALFQATEKASIDYVVMDLEGIKKTINPTEIDLKSYYDQNASKLSGTEERKASHILINAPKSASADERKLAKKQAQDILEQVKKTPTQFADIAKKQSQDSASAVNGGDLGFFARGAMVKAFEDAVFAMQSKQISDLVESDFGYHIIQLNEVKLPKTKSFAEMRPEIEAELKKQQAQKKYAEAAEVFTNTVYEQSDSLKPVADKLKLEIRTAQDLARQPNSTQRGPLSNMKFLNLLFSSDSLDKKRNTEAVELGGSQLVAGRITAYTPAQTKPFLEVKDLAQSMLTAKLSAEMARKEGAAKWAELKLTKDAVPSNLGDNLLVSRDVQNQQSSKLIDAVLKANVNQLPAWVGVDLGAEGYRVVRINKVGEGAQLLANQNRDQYLQVWSSAEGESYYEYLKGKFKVVIKASKTDNKLEAKNKSN